MKRSMAIFDKITKNTQIKFNFVNFFSVTAAMGINFFAFSIGYFAAKIKNLEKIHNETPEEKFSNDCNPSGMTPF